MSRRVVLQDAAREDAFHFYQMIARQNPAAAERFLDALRETCEFLAEHPRVGTRRGSTLPQLSDLRSYGIRGFPNHLILFLPLRDGVIIARVRHGAEDLRTWLGEA
ncbi:MAG TPA: type II toxin-antitoxin system RelE/ParE family toxin [Tepidisphaeraceae bacterium]|nr:type II toxin-antitoxin system RelE/ParE family toxin [Tepidisphaeraceae bacterium]